MSTTESNTNNSTFYLKTALINCAIASKYFSMVIVEEKLKGNSKAFISTQVRKLDSVEASVRQIVGMKYATEIRKEISENWDTLGIQEVTRIMMMMNDDEIRELEASAAFILARRGNVGIPKDEPSGHGGC